MLSNIAAGVILQVSRPFRRGDQITTGNYQGTIRDVNLRATSLRTFDGRDVYLPNRMVLSDAIVNRTRTPSIRTTLDIGVDYETDLGRATHDPAGYRGGSRRRARAAPGGGVGY